MNRPELESPDFSRSPRHTSSGDIGTREDTGGSDDCRSTCTSQKTGSARYTDCCERCTETGTNDGSEQTGRKTNDETTTYGRQLSCTLTDLAYAPAAAKPI